MLTLNNTKNEMKIHSQTFSYIDSLKNVLLTKWNDYNSVVRFQLTSVLSKNVNEYEFSTLLKQMQGIFPSELTTFIGEQSEHKINLTNSFSDSNSKTTGWHNLSNKANLPEPHPANYEWRYTEQSATDIVKMILEGVNENSKICCLGTPSIALELINQGKGNQTTFLDINEPLKKLIETTFDNTGITCKTYDAQNIPQKNLLGVFDIVVINPPWYLDYYQLFISRGIQFLKDKGGKIIMPLFPPLSRHNAINDLVSIKEFIVNSNCTEIKSLGLVEFEMPEFEKAILKLSDTPIPQTNWRNAELVELNYSQNKRASILGNIKIEKRKWLRYAEDKIAVVANPSSISNSTENNTKYTAETKILPTISRKEIEKMEIDVWDSNNKVTTFKKEGK